MSDCRPFATIILKNDMKHRKGTEPVELLADSVPFFSFMRFSPWLHVQKCQQIVQSSFQYHARMSARWFRYWYAPNVSEHLSHLHRFRSEVWRVYDAMNDSQTQAAVLN